MHIADPTYLSPLAILSSLNINTLLTPQICALFDVISKLLARFSNSYFQMVAREFRLPSTYNSSKLEMPPMFSNAYLNNLAGYG